MLANEGKRKWRRKSFQLNMYSTHYSNYEATMDPGSWWGKKGLVWQKKFHKHNRKTFLDTLSQTHRLIASLSPEMEEQRLYLYAAARGSRPRGHVQGKRRTRAVRRRGLHQEEMAVSFGVLHRAWGGIGGGVRVGEGWSMPSGDPGASGRGHSAVKSHSEGKRWASFIYLCLKYLSVTRAVL